MTYNDDTPIVMLSVSQLKNLFKEFASEATPNEKKTDVYLTTEEACHMAKVSRPTLNRWKKAGIIPYVKIGKNVRYKEGDLQNLLESKKR
jgi:excisionase family DNA binding protein